MPTITSMTLDGKSLQATGGGVGTLPIIANGTFDVTSYASASVNVPTSEAVTGTVTIASSVTSATIDTGKQDATGFYVYNETDRSRTCIAAYTNFSGVFQEGLEYRNSSDEYSLVSTPAATCSISNGVITIGGNAYYLLPTYKWVAW